MTTDFINKSQCRSECAGKLLSVFGHASAQVFTLWDIKICSDVTVYNVAEKCRSCVVAMLNFLSFLR